MLHKEASYESDLTGEQERCVSQAYALLLELAKQDYSPKGSEGNSAWASVLPHLHKNKNNQVILLDGRRGSGKTTALLHLVSNLKYLFERTINSASNKPKSADFYQNIATNIAPFGHAAIIPVGIIHLSPIPPDANLFVYLASQFNTARSALEKKYGISGLGANQVNLRSADKWAAFMSIAGSAWNGNLKERASQLDTDSYAMELEQTEGQRMRFRESFYDLINALSEDMIQGGNEKAPLWVIPIDDADMNPHLTKQLLYLLRTLWHPRVAYLLTGDGHLFRHLLRVHVLADMAEPLRQFAWVKREHGPADLIKFSRKLAYDMYDKIIPPSHHCTIKDVDGDERLDKLKGSLNDISFTIDPELPIILEKESGKIAINRVFELVDQTKMALPGRMRTIQNLKAEINGYSTNRGHVDFVAVNDPLRSFITARWRYFLEREFDADGRSRYEHAFPRSPNDELSVNHRPHFGIHLIRREISSLRISGNLAGHITFGRYIGFSGYYETKSTREARELGKNSSVEYLKNEAINKDILGTLLLAMSVFPFTLLFDSRPAADVGLEHWRGKLSDESLNSAFVRTWCNPWEQEDNLFQSARDLIWLGLPIPDWESPFIWMILNHFWYSSHSHCTDIRKTIMIFFWCVREAAVISSQQLRDHDISTILESMKNSRPNTDEQFLELLKKIKDAASWKLELRSQRTIDYINWARCLAVLAASPESCADENLSRVIISELVDRQDDRLIELIRKNRRLRIKCALAEAGLDKSNSIKAADLLIKWIDEKHNRHPWVELISASKSTNSATGQ